MEKINVQKLVQEFDNQNEAELIEKIKSTAQNIVDLRAGNALVISNYIANTTPWYSTLVENINELKSKIRDYYQEDTSYSRIISLCDNIISISSSFIKELKVINNRFKNKKIKISTVGVARGGKSLFTQLFTGLGESVIKTQEGSQDCTGAICNLYQDSTIEQGKFRADIFFHTRDEILERINSLLKDLRNSTNWNPARSNIPPEISTIEEIRGLFRVYTDIAADVDASNANLSVKNGFKAFFSNIEYLNYLNRETETVTTSEGLERYSYMQSKDPLYLAVKEIRLHINMGMGNVCENFIIADTQGASIIAGPKANEDIFKEIDDSDAVFSICPNQGNLSALDFYENVLKPYKDDSDILRSSFPERHFALINLFDNMPDEDFEQTAQQLEGTHTTKCAYLGRLKEASNPEMPKKFVHMVVIDMLKRISNQVLEFDKKRIDNCNLQREELFDKINELNELLNTLSTNFKLDFSEKSYAENRTNNFFNEIISELERMYKSGNNERNIKKDGESDFKDELLNNEQEKDKYVYKSITGNDPTVDLQGKDVESEGVEDLFKKIETKTTRVCDDYNISYYLGDVITDFRKQLSRNMESISKQSVLDVTKEKDEVFNMIFKVLRLSESYQKISNNFINSINNCKQTEYYNNIGIMPPTFMCVNVLKYYFKTIETNSSDEDRIYSRDILDKDILIDALVQEIVHMNIEDVIINHYVSTNVAKLSMYRQLWNMFVTHSGSEYLVDFYTHHLRILTQDDPDFEEVLKRYDSDKKLNELKNIFHDICNRPLEKLELE